MTESCNLYSILRLFSFLNFVYSNISLWKDLEEFTLAVNLKGKLYKEKYI